MRSGWTWAAAVAACALVACDSNRVSSGLRSAASVAVTKAVAQEPGSKGCSLIGSWYGYYAPPDDVEPKWMSTIEGRTPESGTAVLELIGFDSTLGGLFPTAVGGSLIRGSWKKTGPNTFAITGLGFAVDAQGKDVYIARMTGTDTVSDDCNKVKVNVKLQFLDPQFRAVYGPPIPQETHFGYRILVEE